MDFFISRATKRNWEKLAVADSAGKLTKRANKTNSKRRLLPVEYFSDIKNLPAIEGMVKEISASGCDIFDAMYSVVLNIFDSLNIANARKFLSEYTGHTQIDWILAHRLPANEPDLLGLIYQSLLTEGEKNRRGLYYTPAHLAKQLNAPLDFSNGQCLLDPCCGSGSFLLNAPVAHPSQLCGVDSDPIAVMLCKANLIMRFKDLDFEPHVYCRDFLSETGHKKYDYISTNPPWGAVAGNAGESFTRFLYKALDALKEDGILTFLLPKAVLNVKAHRQLRADLIDTYSPEKIELLPNLFTGVATKAVALTVANKNPGAPITIVDGANTYTVDTDTYRKSPNYIFSMINPKDRAILDALYAKGRHYLSNSTWALGIVTGNNASQLSDAPLKNGEPIFTGREIRPFLLLPPQKYIVYDRSRFQQAAKDEIYRAREKLAYKFISKRLIFAYDGGGRLFLNSANVLIPAVPSISIRAMLVLLNSELFQFAYLKQFDDVKVLKGNLCTLPLPMLLPHEDEHMAAIAHDILSGNASAISAAQDAVYRHYGISPQQVHYIREALN